MDNLIIDASIPSGSVILAYGSPSSRSRFPKILAVIAGIFGIIVSLSIIFALTINKVPLPRNVAALAYLPAGTTLPSDAPQLWQDATAHAGRWPVFVGYEKNAENAFTPFAIVQRSSSLQSETRTFGWKLIATTTLATDSKSFFGLPGHVTMYLHGAWLRLDSDGMRVSGTIDAHGWRTDASLPTSNNATRSFEGDNYLDLGTLPGTDEAITAAVGTLGVDIPNALGASAIRWANGASTTAVAFDFENEIPSSTAVSLAEAAGLHDTVLVTLPDGTIRTDLKPPVDLLASSSSTSWEVDGMKLTLSSRTALFSSGLVGWTKVQIPDRCPGRLVAAFDPESQNRIQNALGIFIPDIHSTLFWMEAGGKLEACW
ncbi:MAG: hypothetical protein ABIO72_05500 [Patescibacteria group bacterium]